MGTSDVVGNSDVRSTYAAGMRPGILTWCRVHGSGAACCAISQATPRITTAGRMGEVRGGTREAPRQPDVPREQPTRHAERKKNRCAKGRTNQMCRGNRTCRHSGGGRLPCGRHASRRAPPRACPCPPCRLPSPRRPCASSTGTVRESGLASRVVDVKRRVGVHYTAIALWSMSQCGSMRVRSHSACGGRSRGLCAV